MNFLARTARFPQAEGTILSARTTRKNTISASGRHDSSCTILSARKARKNTISASGRHDFFCTKDTKEHDYRKRNARSVSFACHENRVIDLSISCYSCKEESCRRLVDIVSFVPFVRIKIVPSTCRHRTIRAIRAMKKRGIDILCVRCIR